MAYIVAALLRCTASIAPRSALRRQRKEESRRTARQLRSLPKEEQIPNNNIKKFVYIIIVAIRYIFTANNIFNKIVSISFGLNSHLKLIV